MNTKKPTRERIAAIEGLARAAVMADAEKLYEVYLERRQNAIDLFPDLAPAFIWPTNERLSPADVVSIGDIPDTIRDAHSLVVSLPKPERSHHAIGAPLQTEPRKRRPMSAANRAALSRRMKRYWKARRAAAK